ncbi:hypothetical protein N9095_00330 [bacterium]|nr:hypothetical protein [bacterium]
MADPLSIFAIIGLAYAGRKLSEEPPAEPKKQEVIVEPQEPMKVDWQTNSLPFPHIQKEKFEQPSFAEPQMQYVHGEPVQDFRDRPYVSGKMNNLSPAEKELVGPGLGVNADVPAYGGYQQLFRVNPNNVGAYRLTTLPGRSGPAFDHTGGKAAQVGELTQDRPEKTAFLPMRRPEVRGRAQGQGGSLDGRQIRPSYQKTMRPTVRSENATRTDGLQYAPAKKFISNGQLAQDPTRNKSDVNCQQWQFNNQAAPGISNFYGGYTVAPENAAMGANNQELLDRGFRVDDRRGKANRQGNAGRMNVRAGPLNQGGKVTAVRSDTTRVDGRVGGPDGGWTQNYVNNKMYNFNSFKGNANPLSCGNGLDLAKNQLVNNPFAHSLSQ